ncbi:M23 family metallopeptidase, partial [Microbacteriaceae bacterium K1510]|nr:M23 family metallopeptidase [Microbacteriaceae bacterium K1510]
LLFQSGVAIPVSWKESAREVMTRDFNFSGVANWYEARFGSLPTVLPVFSPKKSAVPATAKTDSQAWKLPAAWKAAESFDPVTGRMVFETGGDANIRSSGKTGWVTYVGERQGYGLMVAVRFPKGREVWYGNLENAAVEQNDVLYYGDLI